MEIQDIIKKLNLVPLSFEGGYYKETYRSDDIVDKDCLPNRYTKSKSICTAIYYFLTPDSFSSLHKLPSDEIFHFYMGDPVEMLQLSPNGSGKIIKIGNNLEKEEVPQVAVPKFYWQGCRLIEGGKYALMGTTVSPGFDSEDFISPDKEQLIKDYPGFEKYIRALLK